MGLDEWLTHEFTYLIETSPNLGDRIVTTADIWPIASILAEKSDDLIELLERYKAERKGIENGRYSRSEEPNSGETSGLEGAV